MNKYQNATFKSIKEAREYIAFTQSRYGFTPQIIKIIEPVHYGADTLPAGLIIEYLDISWDDKKDYVISPLWGIGGYCYIPNHKAKRITL